MKNREKTVSENLELPLSTDLHFAGDPRVVVVGEDIFIQSIVRYLVTMH